MSHKIDKAIEFLKEYEGITPENVHEKEPRGLGSTIRRTLSRFGITEKMLERYMPQGGCGCTEREQFLNKIFPYRKVK